LITREGKGLEGRKTPLIVPMPNPAKIRSVSEKLLRKIAGVKWHSDFRANIGPRAVENHMY
jgi:hypothetical protein